MVRDDLMAERLAAIEVMERTIDSDALSEDELLAWLSAINNLRLVLGTRLDVQEDLSELDIRPDDPRAESLALYAYLSILEEDAVAALS
jgi:hypothetical protein